MMFPRIQVKLPARRTSRARASCNPSRARVVSQSRAVEIEGRIGPKGSGKTFALEKRIRREKCVIFCDPAREFTGTVPAVHQVEDLLAVVRAHDWRRKLHVPWRGSEVMDGGEAFDFAVVVAKAIPRKVVVAANETQVYIPRNKALSPQAMEIAAMGRHINAALLWTARKETDVHPELRGNSDRVDYYASGDRGYLKVVRERGGQEAVDALKSLPRFGFLRFDQAGHWKEMPPA